MNSKATWILLLAAGVLFAFIFFVERPFREARQMQANTVLLPGLNSTNVVALHIRPAGRHEIHVEKINGEWRLVKPIDYLANREFVDALLNHLSELQWHTHISADELKDRSDVQEEFGMNDPQFALKIRTTDSEYNLLVGTKSVVGNEVFVQFVGGSGLYLVDTTWMNFLPRRYEDWKDPSVLPVSILEADAIEVKAGTRGFKLDLNITNRNWRLARPIEARANSEKIVSLMTNLTEARIAAYVSEENNLDIEVFGLPASSSTPPQLELAFFKGTNLIAGLQLGNSLTNSPDHVFAKHLERDNVFVVPKEPFDAWTAPHAEFRDRRLIRIATNKLEQFEIAGSETFTIKRQSGDKWIVTDGESYTADNEAISDLMFVLSNVEVVFENDVVTDFGSFGLTNPIVTYTISGYMTNAFLGREELVQERLRFGTNETGRVFVRRNNESKVYSMHPEEFMLMPVSTWQLSDKQIWNFSAEDVVSILIEQHGKSRKLLRKGKNEWSVAPGSTGIINPFLVEEAVHRLGSLRAVFLTAQGEQAGDPYGFEKNQFKLTIEVRRNGGTELLPLSFGDFSKFNMPYAATMLRGKRVVFEFPLPIYLEFIRRDLSIVPAPLPPQ